MFKIAKSERYNSYIKPLVVFDNYWLYTKCDCEGRRKSLPRLGYYNYNSFDWISTREAKIRKAIELNGLKKENEKLKEQNEFLSKKLRQIQCKGDN